MTYPGSYRRPHGHVIQVHHVAVDEYRFANVTCTCGWGRYAEAAASAPAMVVAHRRQQGLQAP